MKNVAKNYFVVAGIAIILIAGWSLRAQTSNRSEASYPDKPLDIKVTPTGTIGVAFIAIREPGHTNIAMGLYLKRNYAQIEYPGEPAYKLVIRSTREDEPQMYAQLSWAYSTITKQYEWQFISSIDGKATDTLLAATEEEVQNRLKELFK